MSILKAIFARDMGALRALCDEEDVVVRINTPRKEDQCYPIHAAAIKGHAKMLALLLRKGAAVNARHGSGATALILAGQEGHLECANILIESKADINLQANNGMTALYGACQAGHVDVVRLLIKNGCIVDHALPSGATALVIASQRGHVDCINVLVKEGNAAVNAQFQHISILEHAISHGQEDAAAALIALGARVLDEPCYKPTFAVSEKKGLMNTSDKGEERGLNSRIGTSSRSVDRGASVPLLEKMDKKEKVKYLEDILARQEKRHAEELLALRAQIAQQERAIAAWRSAFVVISKKK